MTKKNLVLSDLDGTIVENSLVLSHAKYLIEKSIIKDDGSMIAWLTDVKNEKFITSVAENYRKEIKGMKIEELEVRNFIRKYLTNDENINFKVLNKIQGLKKKGYIVYLVTGSSDFLVKPLAHYFGFNYFATEYLLDENNCLTGEVKGMFNAQQKNDKVKQCFNLPSYDNVIGFGDTFSDNGIFQNCNKSYLVKPSKQTLENFFNVKVSNLKIIK